MYGLLLGKNIVQGEVFTYRPEDGSYSHPIAAYTPMPARFYSIAMPAHPVALVSCASQALSQ